MRIYEGGVCTGIYGKKKTKKIAHSETPSFIIVKYKYDDIVPFNSTLNVTRRQRISMESGVMHWRQKVLNVDYGTGINITCTAYLKRHWMKGGLGEPLNVPFIKE